MEAWTRTENMHRPGMDDTETEFGKDSYESNRVSAVISKVDDGTTMEKTWQTHRSFVERFQEFGNSTTFHGLSYVINNKHNVPRRLVWCAIVLAMSIWLTYYISLAVIDYFKYPITSAISINYLNNITFPAITLCNFNQFRRSQLTPEQLKVFSDIYGPNPPAEIDFSPFDGVDFEINEDQLASISHRLETMLVNCTWKSSQKCTVQNFTRQFTDHGVCFTFNDPHDTSKALQVSNSGRNEGLFLRLFTETDEYAFGENYAAGFRILIHSQGLTPLVKEHGISVAPGFESSIAIKKHVFQSLAKPYRSNCTSSNLTYSTTYTVPICKYECKIKYLMKQCGCRDYRWPGSVRLCHPREHFYCTFKFADEYQLQEMHRDCHCPVPCSMTTFDSRVSIAYWPSSYWNFADSPEYIRKNYLDVYIFYEEIMYVDLKQTSAFDSSALLSGIGGYMGLLCGMSLTTLAEWVDFILISLLHKFKLRKK